MVMQNAVTVNISMALRYIAQASGSMILLFVISWNLTLVMLATVPVVVLGAVAYGLFLKKLAKRTQDALARASEVAEESLENKIDTVKVDGLVGRKFIFLLIILFIGLINVFILLIFIPRLY